MAGIDEYTVLMLHMNGDDESTTFTDDSASEHVITANGNAQIDTAQSKFGGASGLFDGNSDYLSIPDSDDWAFGTGDWAIDFWVRFNTLSGWQVIWSPYDDGSGVRFYLGKDSGNRLYFHCSNSGDIAKYYTSSAVFTATNTWYHVALTRSGANHYIFIDGVSQTLTYETTPDETTNYPNKASTAYIGRNYYGNWYNGWIDEFRISKGNARWTTNFDVPTGEYTEESPVDESETINLSDNVGFEIDKTSEESDTMSVTDNIDVNQAVVSDIVDNFNVTDNILLDITKTLADDEIISLLDEISINLNIEKVNESETISFSDSEVVDYFDIDELETVELSDEIDVFATTGTARNATKILSFNPLVVVTDSSPMKVVRIDITDPANPTWDIYTFPTLASAQDAVYNSEFDLIYVPCANGKLLQINVLDFNDTEIIDTGDTDDLMKISSLDGSHKLFIGTDDTDGEVITMHDCELYKLNTNFIFLAEKINRLNTHFAYVLGAKLNTDFRYIATSQYKLNTDFRYLTDPFDEVALNVIERPDFVVKINGVDVTDVKLDSIVINHTVDEFSTAQFVLGRRHDQLDYTVSGTYQQITNNNQVDIYIDGHHEFVAGKINHISADSENEIVTITARTTEKPDNRKTISLPLASVGEKLHPYQVLLNNPDIDDPYISTLQVIRSKNGQVWTGSSWSDNITSAMTWATFASAQSYLDGNTSKTFTEKAPYVDNYDEDPEYYKGVKVDLGTITIQNYSLWYNPNSTYNAEQIIYGEFEPLQNWAYFWTFVDAENFLTGIHKLYFYIGTSLAPISSDLWNLIGVSYYYQRQFDDKVSEAGWYSVGEAPYLEISTKNGKYQPDYHVEDRTNGLYGITDAGYDYLDFAKRVADLEYEKLKAVGGDVLPKTTCDLELMLDGYYYYNPSLLTRINIGNTTTSNIYNNNNGFPVSVKTIEISSSTMTVVLRTDNSLSAKELKEIEGQYPDEDSDEFVFEEKATLKFGKSDPTRDAEIE